MGFGRTTTEVQVLFQISSGVVSLNSSNPMSKTYPMKTSRGLSRNRVKNYSKRGRWARNRA